MKCAIYDDSSEVFINSVEIDASTVVHVVLQGRDANAFTSRMGGRGSVPRLLRLKPEDVALTRGKPLAKGKFTWITEAGKSERWVVAQCGNHSVGVYVLAQCLHACTHARTLLHSVLVPLTLNRTKRRTHHILQRGAGRRSQFVHQCMQVADASMIRKVSSSLTHSTPVAAGNCSAGDLELQAHQVGSSGWAVVRGPACVPGLPAVRQGPGCGGLSLPASQVSALLVVRALLCSTACTAWEF